MPKLSENFIIEFTSNLEKMFPNARCELDYRNYYELLIAVVLSAQTTDKSVNRVTKVLFSKYPSFIELAKASLSDVEEIIKSIGLYHNKASNIIGLSNQIVSQGFEPNTREELMKLKGVGRKTANVVLSEYFHEPAIAVDTHVKRVAERLHIAKGNELQIEQQLMATFDKEIWSKLHIELVFLGRYVCKSKNPECQICLMKCQK